MSEMTAIADLVVRRLREAGVTTLFGVPGGGSNLDLVDAARRAGLPFVLTATETGGALAAVAQAEISGRPGACLTTLGPGVASVVNGVACAFLDRVPLIVFTDRHPASAAAFDHQTLDHAALLAPVTKWSATLSADNADQVIGEALERATSGRPGPVHIDVPPDVAARCGSGAKNTWRPPSGRPDGPAQPETEVRLTPNTTAIEAMGIEVRSTTRPLLLVGLGACGPRDAAAIRAFCSAHRVPAMVTYKAKGVVADDDAQFAGVFTNGAIEKPILRRADLLIAVGLDPVELLPRPWTHDAPIVSITRWRHDTQHVPFGAQHVGDIAAGLQELDRVVSVADWDLAWLREAVESQRHCMTTTSTALAPDRVVLAAARAAVGVRVTVDAGAHMFPATMLWPMNEPKAMLVSNGLSTMGFALPAAIGAALVDRTRPVIALTGDGGLLMSVGELLTAARERLRVVALVLNDASLSLIAIKQQQRRLPSAGVDLGEVAWCGVAESLGVAAHLAATEAEVEAAMSAALEHHGPSLIEARVDPSAYTAMLRAVRG